MGFKTIEEVKANIARRQADRVEAEIQKEAAAIAGFLEAVDNGLTMEELVQAVEDGK